MNELLSIIKEIELSDISESEYLGNNELTTRMSTIAESLFITNEGRCNWENIEYARSLDIHVFSVEQDRFGWLIAGIDTKKGIVTFG